jgi:hypothetical protein
METPLSIFNLHVKSLISPFNNEPKTMEKIVNPWLVYRRSRKSRELYAFGEQAIMQKHLDFIMSDARVAEEDVRYHRTMEWRG